MERDEHERDDPRPTLPFEGLHVYQRTQEAWAVASAQADGDPLWAALEEEVREAALGIARATALSRSNGGRSDERRSPGEFGAALERARGSLHAAAAVLDQLVRRGSPADPQLRTLLVDASRMLGALVRSLSQRSEAVEEAA